MGIGVVGEVESTGDSTGADMDLGPVAGFDAPCGVTPFGVAPTGPPTPSATHGATNRAIWYAPTDSPVDMTNRSRSAWSARQSG